MCTLTCDKAGYGLRRPLKAWSPMDDDTRELIGILATRVGMLMEDHSVDALTCRKLSAEEIAAKLSDLESTVSKMGALLAAARSLLPQVC